jgi:hypothetical protein
MATGAAAGLGAGSAGAAVGRPEGAAFFLNIQPSM